MAVLSVRLDTYLSYVPVISTVMSLVNLFLKNVWLPKSEAVKTSDHYYYHLKNTSSIRLAILLVPLLGNIGIWLYDKYNAHEGEKFYKEALAEKNEIEKFGLLTLAAHKGHPEAMKDLGEYYYKEGPQENEKKSLEWTKRAAEAGNAEAMRNLVCWYYNEEGENQDETHAFEWARLAAEAGNTEAMILIGWYYEHGIVINKDEGLAFQWYNKASRKEPKNAAALVNLGFCYQHGIGVAANPAQAETLFRSVIDAISKPINRATLYQNSLEEGHKIIVRLRKKGKNADANTLKTRIVATMKKLKELDTNSVYLQSLSDANLLGILETIT